MRKLFLFCFLALSFQWVQAEEPHLAIVTSVAGKAAIEKVALQPLDYVEENQVIEVGTGGKITIGYVKGGKRIRLNGPAKIKMGPQDPVVLEGSSSQLTVTTVKRRIGSKPPEKLDLGNPAAIRRSADKYYGAWLPRKVLPGEQVFRYSAPADAVDARLWVFDAAGLEEVYSGEPQADGTFVIPADTLLPGHTYECTLETRDARGRSTDHRADTKVVVLESNIADELARFQAEHKDPEGKIEYLTILTHNELDAETLGFVESLLDQGIEGPRLREVYRDALAFLQPHP